jgi:general secretion pathway protein K
MLDYSTGGSRKCTVRILGCFFAGRRAHGETGFIVVAVLWILAVLAALISIYAVYVTNAAVSLSVNDDRLQSEALVSAALELSAYQLTPGNQNSGNQNPAPARGQFSFRMGRAGVTVEFFPESARIDLNAAPKELLAGLFTSLGASADDAAYYADRIIAWRTKSTGAGINGEADAYRTAGLSYAPRQAPFANVGELWLVLGLPSALVARVLPFVTVLSGQPTIDILDAAPQVVAALPGMSPDRLYAVLNQRAAAPQDLQSVLALLGPAQGSVSTDAGKTVRIDVDIAFDDGRRVGAEAVILPEKDAQRPYHVLYWRDDFDGGA